MATNKTQQTSESVANFVDTLADTKQQTDSKSLIEIMEAATAEKAALWGANIVGFGKYAYTYASGHSGEAPLLAFSPRKTAISLYIYCDTPKSEELLKDLGNYKMGKSCIYVKKLEDLNVDVLKKLMQESISYLKSTYH